MGAGESREPARLAQQPAMSERGAREVWKSISKGSVSGGYEESVGALTRELADVLGMKVPADVQTAQQCHDWLKANLPAPGERDITSKVALQQQLCGRIAKLLSAVDPNLSGVETCEGLAKAIHEASEKVAGGMMETAAGVQGVINGLEEAKRFASQSKENLEKANETALAKVAGGMVAAYSGGLVTLGGVNEELAAAKDEVVMGVEEVKDAAMVAGGMGSTWGAAWGQKAATGLSAVAPMVRAANVAHDAASRAHGAMQKLRGGAEELQRQIEAASGPEQVRGALANANRDVIGMYGGMHAATGRWPAGGCGGTCGLVAGGLPSMETRMQAQKSERNKLLREFKAKSAQLFEQMVTATYAFGEQIAHGKVALTDDVNRFVRAFDELDTIYSEAVEYVLSGYYRHPSATEKREQFLGKLQAMISVLNGIAGDGARKIKDAAEALFKHVDGFDKFGPRPEQIKVKYGEPTAGGDALTEDKEAEQSAYEGGTVGGNVPGIGLTLKNTARSLRHFVAVAKMRENLKKVSSEAPGYSAKYESVLGDAMAKLIDEEMDGYNNFKRELEGKEFVSRSSKIPLNKAYGLIKDAMKGEQAVEEIGEWNDKAILTMQLNTTNAKVGLYKALQAIDLYLMRFTDEVTANPDSVQEMARLLDSTQIIAEWFKEISGDSIAMMFEYMPWIIEETGIGADHKLETKPSPLADKNSEFAIIETKEGRPKTIDEHYYKHVANAETTSKAHPGNPFLVISPQRAEYARAFAKKTVARMLALKNIVTAFSIMGEKLGKSIAGGAPGPVGMSPGQIYEALSTYLYTSAFAMGWDGYDATVPGSIQEKQSFGLPYRPDGKRPAINMTGAAGVGDKSTVGASAVLMGVAPFVSEGTPAWDKLIDLGAAGKWKERLGIAFNIAALRQELMSEIDEKADKSDIDTLKDNIRYVDVLRQIDAVGIQDVKEAETAVNDIKDILTKGNLVSNVRVAAIGALYGISDMMVNMKITDPSERPQRVALLKKIENIVNGLSSNDYDHAGAPFFHARTSIERKVQTTKMHSTRSDSDMKKIAQIRDTESKILAARNHIGRIIAWLKQSADRRDIDTKVNAAVASINVATNAAKALADNIDAGGTSLDVALNNVKAKGDLAAKKNAFGPLFGPIQNLTNHLKNANKQAMDALDSIIRYCADIDIAKVPAVAGVIQLWKAGGIGHEIKDIETVVGSIASADDDTVKRICDAIVMDVTGGLKAITELAKKINDQGATKDASDARTAAVAAFGNLDANTDWKHYLDLADAASKAVESDRIDYAKTELDKALNKINTEITQTWADNDLNPGQIITGGAAGGVTALQTWNWEDYVNSLDPAGGNRGWLVAFDLTETERRELKTVPVFAKCAFGCAMNSIPFKEVSGSPPLNVNQRTVGGWCATFKKTDMLFVHAIKAMVAKVFTVSGLYNMLRYYPEEHYNALSSTRFILGGAPTPANSLDPVSLPQVHDDAMELYIRLPLLVEFYRDIFQMDKHLDEIMKKDDETIVALVPELDLSWSSLMRLSFDSLGAGTVMTKNYAARMIAEVNAIYERYKSRGPGHIISAVMNDFVADVNSRFGIMTRLEMRKYTDTEREHRRAIQFPMDDNDVRDFDIMHEGEVDLSSVSVPSDKYSKSSASALSVAERNEWHSSFVVAIQRFRELIDKRIRAVTFKNPDDPYPTRAQNIPNFYDQARVARASLKSATSPEQRFGVVYSVMSGIDTLQSVNEYAYVLFHEVVVAPLAVLTAIYDSLEGFARQINDEATVANADFKANTADSKTMNRLFVTVVASIIAHVATMSGLVDIKTAGTKFILDYSRLNQYCEDTLGFVRKSIQRFRGHVDATTIAKYELAISVGNAMVGSIQWLQDNLIDRLFNGERRDPTEITLDRAVKQLTRLFGVFNGNDEFKSPGDEPATAIALKVSYCTAMQTLAYYWPDATGTPSGSFLGEDLSPILTREDKLGRLFTSRVEGSKTRAYEDNMLAARWNAYLRHSDGGFRGDRMERTALEIKNNTWSRVSPPPKAHSYGAGLMMRFNEVLARYLEQFTDKATLKIYQPVIEKFTGIAHSAVFEANGWPDLCESKNALAAALLEEINNPQPSITAAQINSVLPNIFEAASGVTYPSDFNKSWPYQVAMIIADSTQGPSPPAGISTMLAETKKDVDAMSVLNATTRMLMDNFQNSPTSLTQAMNAIRHVFDQAALYSKHYLTMNGQSDKIAAINGYLTTFRNHILAQTSASWAKFGPIVAVYMAVNILPVKRSSTAAGGSFDINEKAVADIVKRAESGPPFADVVDSTQQPPAWGNPDEIVFASLGRCIRTLLTEQEKAGVPAYLVKSLADFMGDDSMKENYRANMPVFKKMFGNISAACGILQRIVAMPKIQLDAGLSAMSLGESYKGAKAKQHGLSGQVYGKGFIDNENSFDNNENAKRYFNRILDKIAGSSNALIECINQVLSDVGDNPLYLETHANSIASYRNVNNVNPFMPPSTMLLALRPAISKGGTQVKREEGLLMPLFPLGSREFEFNYGTRLVLGQPGIPVMLDHMPGLREIVENYNLTTTSDKQLSLETISGFLAKYAQLVRWITDVRTYSPLVNGLITSTGQSLSMDDTLLPCPIKSTLEAAISLTTSSDKPNALAKVAYCFGDGSKSQYHAPALDRQKVQVYNLIDMNLNPININALRREVPLINMLNYSHTFNSFARDMLGGYPSKDSFMFQQEVEQKDPMTGALSRIELEQGAVLHMALNPLSMKAYDSWGAVADIYTDFAKTFETGGHDRFAQDQVVFKALLANPKQIKQKHLYPVGEWKGDEPKNALRYYKRGSREEAVTANISEPNRNYLNVLGAMRHDTTFIRNVLFISTVHRLMRIKMSQALTEYHFPVVTGAPIVNKKITEQAPWETFTDLDSEQ